MQPTTATTKTKTCYHCGDTCKEVLVADNHDFCCVGCKNVYQLLASNNLCSYYQIENSPGTTQRMPVLNQAFAYLEDEKVETKLLAYKDEKQAKVVFFIPTMHCSSCIWLLEHFYKLNEGVVQSKVNFLKKELTLTYYHNQTSLRQVVTTLAQIGYEPAISLNDIENTIKKGENKKLSYQIGVAGFCFGNIMLISFPEYFGLDTFTHASFSKLFGYLNLVLSIPVFLFSAQDYFKASFKAIKNNFISIDVPLALGIFVMFTRSAYEVISGQGIGWFDTHAGLVFFLLIGKWFQQKTFDTLSFERDYKSYFPVAVTIMKEDEEMTVPVTSLNIGDRIKIRNNELIPADAILLQGRADIDFSFVTGESLPVKKELGEIVYAGGRQCGANIELEVVKKVSQSYLTQLWNNDAFAKNAVSRIQGFQQKVSKYFTIALLLIATFSALWWLVFNPSLALNAFSAVLIIACPCALALSSPFALGTAMRVLGRNKFYIKSPAVVEHLAQMNSIVFDKTGTLTLPHASAVSFVGYELNPNQLQLIASLVKHSIHPLSQKIYHHLQLTGNVTIHQFKEITGKGLEGFADGISVQIGSAKYVGAVNNSEDKSAKVYVKLNNQVLGYFKLEQQYRTNLLEVINGLKNRFRLLLLSGDNNQEQKDLVKYFGHNTPMHFNQMPEQKLTFIEELKLSGEKVMMIGDGLNDAGALKAADIGISVTENTANFSPASDVIMDAAVFDKLPQFLAFSRDTRKVIHASFVVSLLYNLVGLTFAVQGTLSPLFAAILMPLSSVTVIAFTTISTTLLSRKNDLL